MDIYRNALCVQEALLRQSGKERWADWLAQDIAEWDQNRSTCHHKSAYGGMTSINDLFIGSLSPEGIWTQDVFETLIGICYEFAHVKQIDLAQHLLQKRHPELTGTLCTRCNRAEVTTLQFESFVAAIHIPKITGTLLPSADYERLSDVRFLLAMPAANAVRNALLSQMAASNIHLNKERETATNQCAACNPANTKVQRWRIKV